jgi:hypothetical protein
MAIPAPLPVQYIASTDLASYGVASATIAKIQQASAIINGFIGRPESLIWMPDYAGRPCWMAGLNPKFNYVNPGAIAVGQNVVVPVTNFLLGLDQVGRVLVVDRGNANLVETASITAIDPVGKTITLDSLNNAHAAQCGLEYGLVIQEERALPDDRPMTRTSRWPLARLVALQGRYAFGRRSEQAAGYHYDFNLLSTIAAFGGPPLWLPVDPANTGMEESTGELWPPAGPYIASYSEVRIHYLSGWPSGGIPNDIKQACANILNALEGSPLRSADMKSIHIGDTAVARFAASFVDDDTRRILLGYKSRLFI